MQINKFAISSSQHERFIEQLSTIKKKIDSGLNGELFVDPDLISKALDDIILGQYHHRVENKILRLISGPSHNLVINPVDGSKIIANAQDIFADSITGFSKSDLPGEFTQETLINVYQMAREATAIEMFKSLSFDFNCLCMTQHQIINYCIKYPEWIHPKQWAGIIGVATLFLCKDKEHYFVAHIATGTNGLWAWKYPFRRDEDKLFPGQHRIRIVTPQIK